MCAVHGLLKSIAKWRSYRTGRTAAASSAQPLCNSARGERLEGENRRRARFAQGALMVDPAGASRALTAKCVAPTSADASATTREPMGHVKKAPSVIGEQLKQKSLVNKKINIR